MIIGLAVGGLAVWIYRLSFPSSVDFEDVLGSHELTRDQTLYLLKDRFQLDEHSQANDVRCVMEVTRAGELGKDVEQLIGCRLSWTAPKMSAWLRQISRDRPADAITPALSALNSMRLGSPFQVDAVHAASAPGARHWYGPVVFVNSARTEAMAYHLTYLAID